MLLTFQVGQTVSWLVKAPDWGVQSRLLLGVMWGVRLGVSRRGCTVLLLCRGLVAWEEVFVLMTSDLYLRLAAKDQARWSPLSLEAALLG